MFGCCNSLFSSCPCRRTCGCGCNPPPAPVPTPIFPPMPPQTPPQLRGMQLSLTGSSAGSVANGACVPFDTVDVSTTVGIACTPSSGKVTIGRTGTYLVNWWVAVENAQAAELMAFAVDLNGSDVQTSYSDIGGGQVYGSAIVNVTSLPATLGLVNRSGDSVTYATAAGQAGMTVTQLA